MSRTYKDKPNRLQYDKWDKDRHYIEYQREYVNYNGEIDCFRAIYWLDAKTTKTKKRKEVDTTDHWMSTPSWWVKTFMTRPQRRQCRLWEREILFTDIEEADCPFYGKKPHVY